MALLRFFTKAEQLKLFGQKREPVKEPGSRGGRGYYDAHGAWQYGDRPTPRAELVEMGRQFLEHAPPAKPPGQANWSKRPMDYEDFAAQYRAAFQRMSRYTPQQAGASIFAEEMAKLADAHPEFLERFEAEEEAAAGIKPEWIELEARDLAPGDTTRHYAAGTNDLVTKVVRSIEDGIVRFDNGSTMPLSDDDRTLLEVAATERNRPLSEAAAERRAAAGREMAEVYRHQKAKKDWPSNRPEYSNGGQWTRVKLSEAQVSALEAESPRTHQWGEYGEPALDRGMELLGELFRPHQSVLAMPDTAASCDAVFEALTHLANSNAERPGATGQDKAAARSLAALAGKVLRHQSKLGMRKAGLMSRLMRFFKAEQLALLFGVPATAGKTKSGERKPVKHPGERGGKGYYDAHGQWQYGDRPPTMDGAPVPLPSLDDVYQAFRAAQGDPHAARRALAAKFPGTIDHGEGERRFRVGVDQWGTSEHVETIGGRPTRVRHTESGDPHTYRSHDHISTNVDARGYPVDARIIHAATREDYERQLREAEAGAKKPVYARTNLGEQREIVEAGVCPWCTTKPGTLNAEGRCTNHECEAHWSKRSEDILAQRRTPEGAEAAVVTEEQARWAAWTKWLGEHFHRASERREQEKRDEDHRQLMEAVRGTPAAGGGADIPRDLAVRAHAGSSFVPERRADQVTREHEAELARDYLELKKLATTPEKQATLDAAFREYRGRYAGHMREWLGRRSGTMSTMIAGPSNFPTRRNEKRLNAEHRKLEEVIDFRTRALAAIRKQLTPELQPIKVEAPDADTRTREKIASLEKQRDTMKLVNALIRKHKKDGPDAQAAAIMAATGFKDETARKLLKPDFVGRIGFPDYELTNTGAEIRRLKAKLTVIEQVKTEAPREAEGESGIRLEDAPQDNRIRVYFRGKPSEEIRSRLKGRGFRWTPSLGCWQAYRNAHSILLAEEIAGAKLTKGGLLLFAKGKFPTLGDARGKVQLGSTRTDKPVWASGAEADGYKDDDHHDAAFLHAKAAAYHDTLAETHQENRDGDEDWRRSERAHGHHERHRKLADHHFERAREHLVAGGHAEEADFDFASGGYVNRRPVDKARRKKAREALAKRTHHQHPGGIEDADRAMYAGFEGGSPDDGNA